MKQPICPICNQILEAGSDPVTLEEINYQPTGIELLRQDFGLDNNETKIKKERAEFLKSVNAREQVQYWAHDPNNLHIDVKVTAHKDCVDKVKATKGFENFDKPTQNYVTHKYPVLSAGVVVAKTVAEFKVMPKSIIREVK